MLRREITIGGLIAVMLLQLYVPLSMIVRREVALERGRAFKFRTAPVDPYDAFRGRYVALRTDQGRVATTNAVGVARGQRVFAVLAEDNDGFALISRVHRDRPAAGDYIRLRVGRVSRDTVRLDLPFDRYYMNEKDAPAAEAAYRAHSRGEKRDAHVVVRVRRGFAVIESLHVGGRTIEEYLADPGAGPE